MGRRCATFVASGKPQPAPVVADIGAQIADGLARAHAAGIVHRDLKPDNVMITSDGLVKILDFGLAKLAPAAPEVGSTLATQSGATAAGVLLGTVGYMSPEQAVGGAVDFRSDQFALGVILYELATGTRAFQRDSAPQTLAAIIEDDPEPVQARNPRVPQQLARIIARAIVEEAGRPLRFHAGSRTRPEGSGARQFGLATVHRSGAAHVLSRVDLCGSRSAPADRRRGLVVDDCGTRR